MITHQFTPGDFGTCRCGAGLGDPVHWGATDAPTEQETDARILHWRLVGLVPTDEPVMADETLIARCDALLDMLAAVLHGTEGHRSLIDRGGFMTPDRQQLLDQAEALVVEIRG